MVVNFFSRHRKGYQISHHTAVNLDFVLGCELGYNFFHVGEGDEGHLVNIALLYFHLEVSPVSADEVEEFFIGGGVSELGNGAFFDGFVCLFVDLGFGDDLVGGGGGGSHQQIGRVACSEHLGPLLEVDVVVFPHVDEFEEIFNLLELRNSFAGLGV